MPLFFQDSGGTNRRDDFADPVERRGYGERRPLVLGPLDLLIQREGNAIRLAAIDRGKLISAGAPSSATKYAFYWVKELDTSSELTIDAGLARATMIDSVARTFVERQAIYGTLLTDAKYSSGFFLCCGLDDEGNRSRPVISTEQNNEILNGAIPGPVTDLQVSESGEQANDTVYSVLAFTYISPSVNGDSFIGIQPVIDNYPALGDRSEYTPLLYDGPDYHGAGGGILRIPIARRIGTGTISIAGGGTAVVGVGTLFTQIAKADDQIEVFGVKRRIQSVNSNTSITISAAWPALTPVVSGVGQYAVLGKCRIFALSLSQTREHSNDESTWPYVDVDIDGELSAPNAPATITLTPFGNGIRLQVVQVAGAGIKGYPVYRTAGTAEAFSVAELLTVLKHDPTTPNGGTVIQYEDTDFTASERETGETFRYYVKTINVRDEPSATYATATATCRGDSGTDGSDPIFKLGLKNSLFNGAFAGTAGNAVLATETSGDAYFGVDGTNYPGIPFGAIAAQAYGAGRFRGYTRWNAADFGAGSAGTVTFENGSEVHIPAPGNGKAWYVFQEIEAWDTNGAPAAAFIKLKKEGTCCWQVKLARQTGGSQPNGTIGIYLDLYYDNTLRGEAPRRQRNPATDLLEYVTGAAAHIEVSGADLLTDWTLYYGIFKLDSSMGTVAQLRVIVVWLDGTQGTVRVCEVMVNAGEEPGVFTPDMGDTSVSWPIPGDAPRDIGDFTSPRDGELLIP